MAKDKINKLFLFDGLKTSLLWDETTDAWVYATGGPTTGVQAKFQMIPTLFRGINIIANSVATMPFKIYKGKGTTELDNSQDYANKIGFLPHPRQTFGLCSMSLDLSGIAYLRPAKNKAEYTKELFYQISSSITPQFEGGKLIGWKRQENSLTKDLKVEELIYMWLPDPYVELGPPSAYPAKAALSASNVLGNMDNYIALYFDHGAIRPVIVSVKGMPAGTERERMEKWFQKLMGGIKRAFEWKIFNADTMTIQQIGDGLESLQDTELTANKRQDVAHALGIPYAILFSEAANNATAKTDQLNLYQQTIEPRCEFIASCLNEQLLIPSGYRLEFTPESLDIYQEDEAERAQSLAALVNSGIPLLMAMDILGYELTEEQRAELEAEKAAKEERSQAMEELAKQKPAEPTTPPQQQPPPEQPETMKFAQTELKAELEKWRRKATNALKRKGNAMVEFDSDLIDKSTYDTILISLETAQDVGAIKAIFDNIEPKTPEDELTTELRRANELLERKYERENVV